MEKERTGYKRKTPPLEVSFDKIESALPLHSDRTGAPSYQVIDLEEGSSVDDRQVDSPTVKGQKRARLEEKLENSPSASKQVMARFLSGHASAPTMLVVTCPVCARADILEKDMNVHLDMCLGQSMDDAIYEPTAVPPNAKENISPHRSTSAAVPSIPLVSTTVKGRVYS
eukprot:GILJ01007958.1.p1 GENE.GILJ01007958.1~~GILJ01007958.1.p1  ORF type:complete len:170 (+),score=21.32 GILJ01007958.1:91-600(+)